MDEGATFSICYLADLRPMSALGQKQTCAVQLGMLLSANSGHQLCSDASAQG
jgi:hypothetical protein